ncbi:hypothetical protein C9374_013974 [Naegleria lovaniensis]|uniref:F-box domain-containing protein n=1 Tax=Naegleria lovaniensis TaxID=51637 RepID=A0AA88H0S6_NAELO|nr:uncharacterized protein C9374_013974 [Naegleria lovaniensis]KAG2389414.1 hypothetical protein C9374_013974 [Naegleria lovaniensis]
MFVPFKKSKDKQPTTTSNSTTLHASSSNTVASSCATFNTNTSLNHANTNPLTATPSCSINHGAITLPSISNNDTHRNYLPNASIPSSSHHHHTTSLVVTTPPPPPTVDPNNTRASVCSSSSNSSNSSSKEEKRKSLTTTHLARLFLSNGNSVKKSNNSVATNNNSVSNNNNKTLSISSSNQNAQRQPFKFQNDVPKISVTLTDTTLSKINASPNNFQSTLERKSSKKQQKRRKYKRNKVTRKPKFFSEDGNAVIKEIEMLELDYDYDYMYGDLPDELIIKIFQYIPVVYLARDVAAVCKRFAVLWIRGVHTVQVAGALRKLKEDDFVKFVRKFAFLEVLDLCNTGSSEDFQITDKGLLQLAHKYIYSNADYLSNPAIDPLSGNYDLNFDYEQHLDSLDESPSLFSSNMDSQSFNDDENDNTENIGIEEDDDVYSVTSTASTDVSERVLNRAQNRAQHKSANFPISTPYNMLFYTQLYQKSYGMMAPKKNPNSREPCYGLQTLHTLNVQGCHFITENGVKYLTYICQNLTHLNVRGCTKVNDSAMSYVSQFSQLEYLDVTGCVHITDVGMKHLSQSACKSKLKYLDLTFCHQITDEGVKYLSEMTQLEDLTLQCCRHITSTGLSHLVNSCQKIRFLNLTGCHLVDLSGVQSEKGLEKLEKLNMMGCKLTNDSCLKVLSQWTTNLRELVLSFSDMITDAGVELVLKNSKHLYHLNLKKCSNITDKTLESISKHLSGVLRYLNLTSVRGFTNEGLHHLQHCQYLQELIIQRCVHVNNDGIANLLSCPSLETLDISENTLVSDDIVKTLAKKGTLRHLKIEKCKFARETIHTLTHHHGISVTQ